MCVPLDDLSFRRGVNYAFLEVLNYLNTLPDEHVSKSEVYKHVDRLCHHEVLKNYQDKQKEAQDAP